MECVSGETIIAYKERLLENIAEIDELTQFPNRYLIQVQEQGIAVTTTIGVTGHYKNDKTFFDVIKWADECMYRGKMGGKNQVVYDKLMD